MLQSALYDETAPDKISKTGKQFIAGVLAHTQALQALVAPTVGALPQSGNLAE